MDTVIYSIHPTTDDYGFQYEDNPIAVVVVEKTDNEADDMYNAKIAGFRQAGMPRNHIGPEHYPVGFYRAIPVTHEEIFAKVDKLEKIKQIWLKGLSGIDDPEQAGEID